MTEKEWFEKYYSPEIRKLIDIFRVVKFGEVKVEIHNGNPVNAFAGPKIRLQKGKNNATNFRELQALPEE